jgi:hypothetical protein
MPELEYTELEKELMTICEEFLEETRAYIPYRMTVKIQNALSKARGGKVYEYKY